MFSFSFFNKKTAQANQSLTELCPTGPVEVETLLVAVSLDPQGKEFLSTQLERDIDGKTRSWNPIPYTLFQLLDFEQLLERKPESNLTSDVLYTHEERRQLAAYVVRYHVMARDIEDFEKATAYNRLLASLLELSTLIKLPL